MLQKLTIKNLAIIDKIDLEFSEGLNVITGETGSGKSIIVNAIDLLMGGQFSKENFRNDDVAEISAKFIFDKKSLSIKKIFNRIYTFRRKLVYWCWRTSFKYKALYPIVIGSPS